MSLRATIVWLVLIPAGAVCGAAHAGESPGGGLTFTLENDLLTGSDNSYTNGVGVTWVSGELDPRDAGFVGRWADFWSFLPFVGDEGYRTYASWTLGQEMHTPDDIEVVDPPLTDQPYAGILYVDSVLYARSGRWTHAWELKLGVVGPDSQAENVQKDVHELIGGDEPLGWDTQLPNEPVLNVGLTSAYLWREGYAGRSAQWRLVPLGHVGIGNYFTGIGLGMYGEVGWNLADALGGAALREGLSAASTVGVVPVDRWSVSLFGGLSGHAIAHYLPLDGTLFRDSRSVDTKPVIGAVSVGLAVRRGVFSMSLATTFSTDAFDGQEHSAEFGTLNVSWLFQ